MDTFQVHSYHINVDVGDAAIHLLVKNSVIPVSVVLIDAGRDSHGGFWIDDFCQRWLKTKYSWPEPGKVKFDTVVVTHWDDDHYGGVLELLRTDFQKQYNELGVYGLDSDIKEYKCSYFKYGADNQPQTYLYAPYWDPKSSAAKANIRGAPTKDILLGTDPANPNRLYVRFSPPGVFVTVGTGSRTKKLKRVVWVKDVAQVRCVASEIVGMDFFTNKLCYTSGEDIKEITSPLFVSDWIVKDPGREGDGTSQYPVLFCVRSDATKVGPEFSGVSWNNDPKDPSFTFNPPADPASSAAENLEPLFSVKLVSGSLTNVNESSIAAVVIWPDSETSKGRITHYTAGDAGDKPENDVLLWTTKPHETEANKRVANRCAAMKMSHHGARQSTPANLIYSFNPEYIVVSNGLSKTNNHPRWELLFFLDAWAHFRETSGLGEKKFLYATNYPIYFARLSNGIDNGYTPGSVDYIRNDENDLRTAVKSLWDAAPLSLDINPLRLYDIISSFTTPEDYIVSYLAGAWVEFSPITRKQYAAAGTSVGGSDGLVNSADQRTRAIRVIQTESEVKAEVIFRTDTVLTKPAFVPNARVRHGKSIKGIIHDVETRSKVKLAFSTIKTPVVAKSTAIRNVRRKYRKGPFGSTFTSALVDEVVSPQSNAGASLGLQDPPDTTHYYFVSSLFTVEGGITQFHTVQQSTPLLDNLLLNLHSHGLVLETPPEDAGSTVALAAGDEWNQWMVAVMGDVSGFKSGLFATATPTGISSFSLRTCFAAAYPTPSAVPPGGLTQQLIFSSDNAANTLAFNIGGIGPWKNAPETGADAAGILLEGDLLVMSLTTDSAKSIGAAGSFTAADILKMFEIDSLAAGLFNTFKFNLDVSDGSRNSVWFESKGYLTSLRLQFKLDLESRDNVESIFSKYIPGLNLSGDKDQVPVKVIGRKSWQWGVNQAGDSTPNVSPEFILTTDVTLHHAAPNEVMFTAAYIVQPSQTQYMFIFGDQGTDISSLLSSFTFSSSIPSLGQYIPFAKDIKVRRVTFTDSEGQLSVVVDFELSISDLAFLVTFVVDAQPSFYGTLWVNAKSPEFTNVLLPVPLLPNYEPFRSHTLFSPTIPTAISNPGSNSSIHIAKLHEQVTGEQSGLSPPNDIGTDIFGLTFAVDESSISFSGMINRVEPDPSAPPPPPPSCPVLELGSVSFALQYTFSTKSLSLFLEAIFVLEAPHIETDAVLDISVEYDSGSGSWELNGSVSYISIGLLYSLFDEDCNLEVMNILSEVGIQELDLTYRYDQGNYFLASGILQLGELLLDFQYDHPPPPPGGSKSPWSFKAQLSIGEQNSSLLSIIQSVCGENISSVVPNCFGNTPITPSHVVTDPSAVFDPASSPVELEVIDIPADSNSKGCFLFKLRLTLAGDLHVVFVQYQEKGEPGETSETRVVKAVKRVIKLSVGALPGVSGVPVLGKLAQPFDEMDFVWVHEDASGEAADGGLKRSELEIINQRVFNDEPTGLRFKDPYITNGKQTPKYSSDNILLSSGSHFLVILNNAVALDYPFNSAHTTAPPEPEPTPESGGQTTETVDSPSPTTNSGSTKAAVKKTIGPLTISSIGLRYDSDKLYVLLDATVSLGPVEFKLLDFGLGIDLSHADLHHIPHSVDLVLSGLGMEFNAPPLQITGIFERTPDDMYIGGASLAMDPYLFMAVGEYGNVVPKGSSSSFKCIFVFAQLDGPLVNVGFAEIVGIRAGFGYNTSLRYPDLTTISQFPFTNTIQAAETGDPLTLLSSFLAPPSGQPWITPTPGPIWIAAGLEVMAFEVIDISAIIVINCTPDVNLAIFANGVAQMPEAVPPTECFLYVEFGFLATVDFQKGTLVIEASLSPNSFVLDPSCHLAGGFALCSWWAGSEHAGDWVYSVGGYHAAYHPPPHYPVPQRLSISWRLDNCLSITGEAYFAVTPQVAMGGGSLAAVFSAGPLSAYFNAWADFLINYSPFHFAGDVGVSVGVEFTLDLFFCTLHIGVHIGANLSLIGPPFSGVVHVDFWVFGFDIHFGPDSNRKAPLSIDEFCDLLMRQAAPQPKASTPTSNSFHVLTLETGLVPSQKSNSAHVEELAPWNVRAGTFTFRVHSHFAIQSSILNKGTSQNQSNEVTSQKQIYSKPMKLSQHLDSEMLITVARTDEDKNPLRAFRLVPIIQTVPSAIWEQYSEDTDPEAQGNQIDSLLSSTGPGVNLMMGVAVTVPKPLLSNDTLSAYNAAEASVEDILSGQDMPILPHEPTQSLWLPEQPSQTSLMATSNLPSSRLARWGLRAPAPPIDSLKNAWDNVSSIWGDQKLKNGRKQVVDAWAEAFGWTDDLNPSPLDMLLDNFGSLYMACPLVSAHWAPPSQA